MSSTREPIKVVADILKTELNLKDTQILLDYEKFDIEPTPGLYIALSYASTQIISNINYSVPTNVGMDEIQELNVRHLVNIDILSFNSEARTMKEFVVMALQSIYSQRLQGDNLLQIAMIPDDILNTSSLEETKMLNRFSIPIAVTSLYRRVKPADFFNDFDLSYLSDFMARPKIVPIENPPEVKTNV